MKTHSKAKTILLPQGLSSEDVSICKNIFQEFSFIDNPRFHQPFAKFKFFPEKQIDINLSNAEIAWYNIICNWFTGIPLSLPVQAKDTKFLLTFQEEQQLFYQYNYARMRVFNIKKRNINKKIISLKDVNDLLFWFKISNKIRSKLYLANIGIVTSVLKRRKIRFHYDYSEFVEEGLMILLRSIDAFDAAKGFKLSTYAWRSISSGLNRYYQTLIKRCSKIKLSTDIGRHNAEDEDRQDDNLFIDHKDLIISDRKSSYIRDDIYQLIEVLKNNTAELSDIEYRIIQARFFGGDTLKQVGKKIGVCRERIRQIQRDAIKKLRTVMILPEEPVEVEK